jgi:hypothetical protein
MYTTDSFVQAEIAYREERVRADWRPVRRRRGRRAVDVDRLADVDATR